MKLNGKLLLLSVLLLSPVCSFSQSAGPVKFSSLNNLIQSLEQEINGLELELKTTLKSLTISKENLKIIEQKLNKNILSLKAELTAALKELEQSEKLLLQSNKSLKSLKNSITGYNVLTFFGGVIVGVLAVSLIDRFGGYE